MQQWEYDVEHIGGLFRSAMLEARILRLLNQRGREGWELDMMRRAMFTRRTTLWFKRAKCEA